MIVLQVTVLIQCYYRHCTSTITCDPIIFDISKNCHEKKLESLVRLRIPSIFINTYCPTNG